LLPLLQDKELVIVEVEGFLNDTHYLLENLLDLVLGVAHKVIIV
jgi:hypothetical protein